MREYRGGAGPYTAASAEVLPKEKRAEPSARFKGPVCVYMYVCVRVCVYGEREGKRECMERERARESENVPAWHQFYLLAGRLHTYIHNRTRAHTHTHLGHTEADAIGWGGGCRSE